MMFDCVFCADNYSQYMMVWYGMVWYGMVYLFFHRQYKVISKQIAIEMLPYTVNERRPPYNPKVVLPQLLYRFKHNTLIHKKKLLW